jgi:hypothetical protein
MDWGENVPNEQSGDRRTVQGIGNSLSENNFTPLGQAAQKGDTRVRNDSVILSRLRPYTERENPSDATVSA